MITTVPADFITVADVKTHMDKGSSADDAELVGFVSAACEAIRERIGEVSPVTAVVDACSYGSTIVLEHRPVISVTKVEQLPGLTVVPAGDAGAGTDGWVLENHEGVLRHTSRFPGRVRVTYQAGRDPLPGNIRLAALELASHLWRTTQLNPGGGRPTVGSDEVIVPGVTYALPYNVRQLLGLDKRPIDEILVG